MGAARVGPAPAEDRLVQGPPLDQPAPVGVADLQADGEMQRALALVRDGPPGRPGRFARLVDGDHQHVVCHPDSVACFGESRRAHGQVTSASDDGPRAPADDAPACVAVYVVTYRSP